MLGQRGHERFIIVQALETVTVDKESRRSIDPGPDPRFEVMPDSFSVDVAVQIIYKTVQIKLKVVRVTQK